MLCFIAVFWDDIGIIPDVLIENRQKDIDNGMDKALDYAINLLTNKNK